MFVFKRTMKLRNYVFMYMNLQRSQNDHSQFLRFVRCFAASVTYTDSTVVCTV